MLNLYMLQLEQLINLVVCFITTNLSLLIALGGLFISLVTIRNTNKIQKDALLTDMIQREFELRLTAQNKENKEIFYNFVEYFAFLINSKQVSEKNSKELLENEFYKVKKLVQKEYSKDFHKNPKLFENLIKLTNKWKKQ